MFVSVISLLLVFVHLVSQLNSISAKLECLWSRRDFPVHDWFSEFFVSLKGGEGSVWTNPTKTQSDFWGIGRPF